MDSFTDDDRRIMQDLLIEVRRFNEMRSEELKIKRNEEKRSRRLPPNGWLNTQLAMDKLYPMVTESQGLKLMRGQGLFGMPGEGYQKQGRAFFYNPYLLEKLHRKYVNGTLQEFKREKNN